MIFGFWSATAGVLPDLGSPFLSQPVALHSRLGQRGGFGTLGIHSCVHKSQWHTFFITQDIV